MEIKAQLDLTHEEESLVDMHSVLNVLNVIIYELILVGEEIDASDEIDQLVDEIYQAADRLKDPKKALRMISCIETLVVLIEERLDEIVFSIGEWAVEKIARRRDNLRNIYEVIRVRVREIQERNGKDDIWVRHGVKMLRERFDQFLEAVEKNSHGRYRISRNIADKGEGDYLIHFDITSECPEYLWMPIVFQDVMRDLLANSRKYTVPGGKIVGGVHYGGGKLKFVIEDSGIGIPEGEIQDSVAFGYRASNGLDLPSRGGGFGLTKAYSVTRKFNGRMWIDSSPLGTRIEIVLPVGVEKEKDRLARLSVPEQAEVSGVY